MDHFFTIIYKKYVLKIINVEKLLVLLAEILYNSIPKKLLKFF